MYTGDTPILQLAIVAFPQGIRQFKLKQGQASVTPRRRAFWENIWRSMSEIEAVEHVLLVRLEIMYT